MWPKKMMPEPMGAKRLIDYNIKVTYKKDLLESPVKIKNPNDYEEGTRYPKMKLDSIWIVEIKKCPELLCKTFTEAQWKLKVKRLIP